MINYIYSDKASYTTKEPIYLIIESNIEKVICDIEIYNLEKKVQSFKVNLKLGTNKINIGLYEKDLSGYLIVVKCDNKIYTTAFSIDSNNSIIRYGFLSDFNKMDDNFDIKWLNLNHINYVQFYDWSYRHDNMVPPVKTFKDAMGKNNNLDVIKNKINTCKGFGMKPMGYGPIYAATKEYYLTHKDQAYYQKGKRPLTFIDIFYFMNIENEQWVSHIIEEYKKSIEKVGFLGIHLDTYGYPKRALDSYGEVKYLDYEIPKFLDKVSKKLFPHSLIFNNVGAWPLKKLNNKNQIATYIEVWPPYETFYHLKELINKAKNLSKPVVLAAYLQSFRLDRDRAFYNALLVNFFINSQGATHLFLGEEKCVITQGYYCDYSHLEKDEAKILKHYQDFYVMYQELLFDDSLKDVTMTHCGWDNEEYQIEGNYSLTSQPNKISVVLRTNGKKHLICLLNLENNDEVWNKGKNEPSLSSPLLVKIQVFKNVENVYFADPDTNLGRVQKLKFSRVTGKRSDIIEVEIPHFKVGSILWLEEK